MFEHDIKNKVFLNNFSKQFSQGNHKCLDARHFMFKVVVLGEKKRTSLELVPKSTEAESDNSQKFIEAT